MKKINALLLLPLLFALSSVNVWAEALTDEGLAGSWLLEYTKNKAEDENKAPMGITWELKNHKLIMRDVPQSRGNPYDSMPVDYLIENGNLKVGVLGRAGKFNEYALVEKTDKTMILKDPKFGTLYYFVRK